MLDFQHFLKFELPERKHYRSKKWWANSGGPTLNKFIDSKGHRASLTFKETNINRWTVARSFKFSLNATYSQEDKVASVSFFSSQIKFQVSCRRRLERDLKLGSILRNRLTYFTKRFWSIIVLPWLCFPSYYRRRPSHCFYHQEFKLWISQSWREEVLPVATVMSGLTGMRAVGTIESSPVSTPHTTAGPTYRIAVWTFAAKTANPTQLLRSAPLHAAAVSLLHLTRLPMDFVQISH